MGNGEWLIVGGNQPVTTNGVTTTPGGPDPYKDQDGGVSSRLVTPCMDESCQYSYGTIQSRRWYPTLETLADGSVIIIGGDMYGGFVNNGPNNNPTYEFYPSRGAQQQLPILLDTLPANLYPLTWLLPSGQLFLQLNWGTELFNPDTGVETRLPNVTHAVRTYPASAASAMLPLTPANNYTATILLCGGTDLLDNQWATDNGTVLTVMTTLPAVQSCVTMTPDTDPTWHDDDDLPGGRTMGNFIILPDQTLFLCNGAKMGVAGYGTQPWVVSDSYADIPLYEPYIYDPSKPAGSRFSNEGLQNSTIARMYHSTATLLPDGSVFVAGSSPHPDVVLTGPYPTEYRIERFYPWYFNKPRPFPQGWPTSLTYGGNSFDLTLTSDDLNGDGAGALEQTTVMLIRTGYATHAINFGQRALQLDNTYTLNDDGSAVLHVSQIPPNPSMFAPGPAWLFCVVNGVPSIGVEVVVGSGKIEVQSTLAVSPLPASKLPKGVSTSNANVDPSESAASPKAGVASLMTMLVGAAFAAFVGAL